MKTANQVLKIQNNIESGQRQRRNNNGRNDKNVRQVEQTEDNAENKVSNKRTHARGASTYEQSRVKEEENEIYITKGTKQKP
jgi:hypothetical protein